MNYPVCDGALLPKSPDDCAAYMFLFHRCLYRADRLRDGQILKNKNNTKIILFNINFIMLYNTNH